MKTGTLILDEESFLFYDCAVKKTSALSNGKGAKQARLYLPASWIGKRVMCLLLDEVTEDGFTE